MKKKLICMFVLLALMMSACGTQDKETASYRQISQEEAMEMMTRDDGHVIVDVRTYEEYDEGHIPDAICIPNESIIEEMPAQLSDPDQIILVYCRSGNRSKQAAEKLANIGYTNVYEFGGINTWTGETVKEDNSIKPIPILHVEIGGEVLTIDPEDNSSVLDLIEKLSKGSVTLEMEEYGGFEKVAQLPWSVETNDEEITTKAGDVILYQGNTITIYYGQNTYSLTRLGHINIRQADLKELLGEGNVTATFYVEWTE